MTMSLYSLDSLDAEGCKSEDSAGSMWTERGLEAVSSSGTNRGSSGVSRVVGNSDVRDKSMKAEKRNALIAPSEPLPMVRRNQEVVPRRRTRDGSSSSSTLETRVSSNASRLKNDKKLNGVLPPKIIEAKTKPKTYLEQYHRRSGVPVSPGIYSPEGSALSIFGDSSREQISDVESRPSESTPRDDQSELSFYRRLINHPRTSRSWDVNERHIASGNLRSVSDYGMTTNEGNQASVSVSYRPYSIRDYECLTVPRPDRSLGPDPVEIREKCEKLQRRTRYGDLASTRNRENVVRRFELGKWKRTNVEKASGEFPLTKDVGAGLDPESKLTSKTQPDVKPPGINIVASKKDPRILRPRRIAETETKDRRKIMTKFKIKTLGPSSRQTVELQAPGDSTLEDLQRRHQNEKRVVDILVNRTLLR